MPERMSREHRSTGNSDGEATLITARFWSSPLTPAVLSYAVSLAMVLAAVFYATLCIPVLTDHPAARDGSVVARMAAWDGEWYVRIAASGYSYAPRQQSSVAFFPAYPLIGRLLSDATGLSIELSLLLISNACLALSLVCFAKYLRLPYLASAVRSDGVDVRAREPIVRLTLFAFALFPSTFYFRMAYTESLLLLLMLAAMYGMRQNWHPAKIALLVGLATATRSVGIALLVPFAMHMWSSTLVPAQSPSADGQLSRLVNNAPSQSVTRRWLRVAAWLLVSCWGLLGFMAYQSHAFGFPTAFVRAQENWHDRAPAASGMQRVKNLATLEPVRSVYASGNPCHWKHRAPRNDPLLNLNFWNPIFFLAALVLVTLGGALRWVSPAEWALAMLLLVIPYVMQGNRMCMTSQARFSSIVFPAYVVWGRLLSLMPRWLSCYLLVTCGALLIAFTALFVSWYFFF